MDYGKTETGTVLTLTSKEDARLRSGETVFKENGYWGGDYTITVRMEYRLAEHQEDALRLVRYTEGRQWKARLRHFWETGNYPATYHEEITSILQHLRNAHWFGPTGLDKLRLGKPYQVLQEDRK